MKKYNANSGWFNESHRHKLSRLGVKTGHKIDYSKYFPEKKYFTTIILDKNTYKRKDIYDDYEVAQMFVKQMKEEGYKNVHIEYAGKKMFGGYKYAVVYEGLSDKEKQEKKFLGR